MLTSCFAKLGKCCVSNFRIFSFKFCTSASFVPFNLVVYLVFEFRIFYVSCEPFFECHTFLSHSYPPTPSPYLPSPRTFPTYSLLTTYSPHTHHTLTTHTRNIHTPHTLTTQTNHTHSPHTLTTHSPLTLITHNHHTH